MQSIERKVLLRAPRSRVWNALTDVQQFCHWFGVESAAGVFTPGAKVHMAASEEHGGNFDVFVQEMQPEHLFTWRWHPGAHDPSLDYAKEPTTLVAFKLADAEGGTLLTITESGFDRLPASRRAEAFRMNEGGWASQSKKLANYVG